MKFKITVPKKDIKKSRADIVNNAIKSIKIKGFRKGKAPKKLVKKELDESKIIEEIIRTTIPPIYQKHIKKNDLRPITNPKITPLALEPDTDWNFDVEIAQKPKVDLPDYKETVKKSKPTPKIIKPGEKDEVPKDPKQRDQELLLSIYAGLVKAISVNIPEMLIEEEVNHALSHLLQQVEKLGLTIDQYLSSMGKDIKQLKQEYANKAEYNLKVDFIIDAIAREEKIIASNKDLKDFLDKVQDENALKAIQSSPYQQALVKNAITRDRVVEHLKSL